MCQALGLSAAFFAGFLSVFFAGFLAAFFSAFFSAFMSAFFSVLAAGAAAGAGAVAGATDLAGAAGVAGAAAAHEAWVACLVTARSGMGGRGEGRGGYPFGHSGTGLVDEAGGVLLQGEQRQSDEAPTKGFRRPWKPGRPRAALVAEVQDAAPVAHAQALPRMSLPFLQNRVRAPRRAAARSWEP